MKKVRRTANIWEPSDELQEFLEPSGAEIQNESEKLLLLPPAGSQKVWKKVSNKSRTDIFETFSRLFGPFRAFRDHFQTLALRPWETFFRLFWISGPEGPRVLCSSSEGCQETCMK